MKTIKIRIKYLQSKIDYDYSKLMEKLIILKNTFQNIERKQRNDDYYITSEQKQANVDILKIILKLRENAIEFYQLVYDGNTEKAIIVYENISSKIKALYSLFPTDFDHVSTLDKTFCHARYCAIFLNEIALLEGVQYRYNVVRDEFKFIG